MKTTLTTLLLIVTALSCFAQHPYRPKHGKDGYYLTGKMTIYMKNKEVVEGEFNINNIKFTDSDINYQDVDFIVQNAERYEYVNIGKKQPQLLKAYYFRNPSAERGKVMFYESIPKWVPKVNQQMGFRYSESYITNHYMLKEGMDKAVKFKSWKAGELIKKYFSDCPPLMAMYKDKKQREKVTYVDIFKYYNGL